MPSNQNLDPFQYTGNSGQNLSGVFTANVPWNESTGSQYQAGGWTEIITASGFQSSATELNAVEEASLIVGLGQSGANPGGPTLLGFAPGVIASGNNLLAGPSVSGVIPVGLVVEGIVANSGIGLSGYAGNQAASIFPAAGSVASYSGASFATVSAVASNSGGNFNAPVGTFLVQVLGLSGNPYVKVPFYNS